MGLIVGSRLLQIRLIGLVLCLAVSSAFGQITETNLFDGVNRAVPDGTISGIEDPRTNVSRIVQLTGIRVHLQVIGEYNGDLYAYLRHSGTHLNTNVSHLAILLNRPGRSSQNSYGYSDDGLDIYLSDAASSDIHSYQTVIKPAAGTPLTGDWQPDARFVDPFLVTTDSPRLASLSDLNGMAATGQWTLFVADVDAGGTNFLAAWGLELTGKVVPDLTWNSPAALVYGSSLTTNELNATSAVPGRFVYNPPLGAVLNASTNQILTVNFYPTDTNQFVSTSTNVNIAILPQPLVVTAWDGSKTYGESLALDDTRFTVYGLTNGDTVLNVSLTSVGAQASSSAGSYPINPGPPIGNLNLNNYSLSNVPGTLTVLPAALIGQAEAVSRHYGQPNPPFTVIYSGFVNGEDASVLQGSLAGSCPATTLSPVGQYAFSVSGQSNPDYAITFEPGVLTVTPAPLLVTALDTNRFYGLPNPPFAADYTGFVNGEDPAVLDGILAFACDADLTSPVGHYSIVPAGLDATNYSIIFSNGTLVIAAYELSVSADSLSRVYGQTNPVLSGTLLGLQNGDNISATFQTEADFNSHAGNYPITIELLDPDLKLPNYLVSTNNGTLTILPAALVGQAEAVSRYYGQPNPSFTATYSGFVNGEDASVLQGSLAGSCPATTLSPVGQYAFSVSGQSNPDYAITFEPGVLTVTPAPLLVTALDTNRFYGLSNPPFAADYTGFVNGEDPTVLDGALAFACDAGVTSAVGHYSIVPAGLAATNYSINFSNGTLSVAPAPTFAMVRSSTNMASPGEPVSFFATVGPEPPVIGVPSGSVQFKIDDVNYGSPVAIVSGPVSLTSPGLSRGIHAVGVEYSGDENFLSSTNRLIPDQLVNNSPKAADVQAVRPLSYTTKIGLNYLLANSQVASGGNLVLSELNPVTAGGGTVLLTNNWIVYTPSTGGTNTGTDSITYTVQDDLGVISTGTITINPVPDSDAAATLNLASVTDSGCMVQIQGVPWGTYALQSRESLLSSNRWGFLALANLDENGRVEVPDSAPTLVPSRFYRAVFQGGVAVATSFRTAFQASAYTAAPGFPLSFALDVIPLAASNPPPQGIVQFYWDRTNSFPDADLVNGSAILTSSALPWGSHKIAAAYAGDQNFNGFALDLGASVIIDSPPVVVPYDLSGANSQGVKVSVTTLLTMAASDPDPEDTVVFSAVDPDTTEGGRVTSADGWIYYTPRGGLLNVDSFTYSVSDSLGLVSKGMVNVIPAVISDASSQLLIYQPSPSIYSIQLSGVPWHAYTFEYSSGPQDTNWIALARVTANSQGIATCNDTLPEGIDSRCYRAFSTQNQSVTSPFQLDCWNHFLAITNNRSMELWVERYEPPGWPDTPPILAWNTNCLIYGADGFTAISQCNQFEGAPGQVPVTLLTRRHAFVRGHGFGDNGFHTNRLGQKVWFCTASNTVVTMTVAAEFVRNGSFYGQFFDYGLIIFTEDVPDSLTPMSVMFPDELGTFYYPTPEIPYLILGTEQEGHVATEADPIPPFVYWLFKGGDSGSPNFLLSPDNKLIMISARGCSQINPQLAADLDTLTLNLGLDPAQYQLNWYDLSPWGP